MFVWVFGFIPFCLFASFFMHNSFEQNEEKEKTTEEKYNKHIINLGSWLANNALSLA